ncbi:MAG: CoA-binding protein [Candidatus Heimdallarchaeota archaeon]|nr:CoA-binding protein [Candidatus Heimdallarchaeota archaeon]
MIKLDDSVVAFFEAQSYAIVGATGNRDKLGWHIVENFLTSFKGQNIFFVNPKGGEIEGRPVYKSIKDIPEPVDAVVIAIPARFVLQVVEDCVEKGVKSVIIESGGFAEIGPEGALMQEKLKETIAGSKTRLIGPNCIGVLSPDQGIDTIFIPQGRVGRPRQGPISFFTQSGALGSAILSAFNHLGDGQWISRFASYGNAVDVNETDFIKYFGHDPETKIIMAHLEGFRNGSAFLNYVKKITPKKPVIVLKTNRTELGATASASHSASVAANDEVVSALLKQHGVIRVNEFEELIRLARALRTQPIPRGPRVGVVTDGGGFAVSASDAIEREGLELGTLSKKTIETFKAKYPPWYISGNPLDLTGTVTAEEFQFGIEQFCFDPNIDIVMVIIIPSAPQFDVHEFLNLFSEFYIHVKSKHPESAVKPIFACSLGGEESEIIEAKLDRLDIPVYVTPDRAMTILRYLVEYRRFLNTHQNILREGRY